MTRLKYLDPADGQYKLLPVGGGGGGGAEEVVISAGVAPALNEELWVDTSATTPVYDWSYADNRYLSSGFRNVVRNGDFSIAQRGLGPFTALNYTMDGWILSYIGGTVSVNKIQAVAGEVSPRATIAVSGQSAAGDYAQLLAPVEDVNTLNGKTVTISFDAWAATAGLKLAVELQQHFGTGGTPSAIQSTPVSAVTLTTTKTRYSLTVNLPSVAGATLGTNGNHSLRLIFWASAGSSFNTRASSIGTQSGTFNITDIQLEAGSAASPFERLPVQQQLAWCQRYFQRHYFPNGDDVPGVAGVMYQTNQFLGSFSFPGGYMRVPPTATSSGTWEVVVGNGVLTGALSFNSPSSTSCQALLAVTGGVIGHGAYLRTGSMGNNNIDLSAEY